MADGRPTSSTPELPRGRRITAPVLLRSETLAPSNAHIMSAEFSTRSQAVSTIRWAVLGTDSGRFVYVENYGSRPIQLNGLRTEVER